MSGKIAARIWQAVDQADRSAPTREDRPLRIFTGSRLHSLLLAEFRDRLVDGSPIEKSGLVGTYLYGIEIIRGTLPPPLGFWITDESYNVISKVEFDDSQI